MSLLAVCVPVVTCASWESKLFRSCNKFTDFRILLEDFSCSYSYKKILWNLDCLLLVNCILICSKFSNGFRTYQYEKNIWLVRINKVYLKRKYPGLQNCLMSLWVGCKQDTWKWGILAEMGWFQRMPRPLHSSHFSDIKEIPFLLESLCSPGSLWPGTGLHTQMIAHSSEQWKHFT